jgi:hypothetical protein
MEIWQEEMERKFKFLATRPGARCLWLSAFVVGFHHEGEAESERIREMYPRTNR